METRVAVEWMPPQDAFRWPTVLAQRPVQLEIHGAVAKRQTNPDWRIQDRNETRHEHVRPLTALDGNLRLIPGSISRSHRWPPQRFHRPVKSGDAGGGVTGRCFTWNTEPCSPIGSGSTLAMTDAGAEHPDAITQNSCLFAGIPVRRGNLSGVSTCFCITWKPNLPSWR